MSRAKLALGVPLAMAAADQALFAMLRRARPRPFGLTTPAATPAMLSSAGQSGLSSFTSVVLCYGLPLRVAGPLSEVQTCFSGRDCYLPTLQRQSPALSYGTRPGPGKTGRAILAYSPRCLRCRSLQAASTASSASSS